MATYRDYIARVQMFASVKGIYTTQVDGIMGGETQNALDAYPSLFAAGGIPAKEFQAFSEKRKVIAFCQTIFKTNGIDTGKVDGYAGAQTEWAFDQYAHLVMTGEKPAPNRDDEKAAEAVPGPIVRGGPQMLTPLQRDVAKVYGEIGQHHTKVVVPYDLKIDWNRSQIVRAVTCHEKVADAFVRVMNKVASAYSPEDIAKHGFNIYGGCYNPRKMRGGSAWSMHAWAIAFDFDPSRNTLKMGPDKAYFAKPECREWNDIWESEGFTGLGRAAGYDFMHYQFARVR